MNIRKSEEPVESRVNPEQLPVPDDIYLTEQQADPFCQSGFL